MKLSQPLLWTMSLLVSCVTEPQSPPDAAPQAVTAQAVTAPAPAAAPAAPAEGAAPKPEMAGEHLDGTLLESVAAGGYTYLRIQTADGEIWAAGPQSPVAVGDKIRITAAMMMRNFHSEALDRDFEELLFIEGVEKLSENGTPMAPPIDPATDPMPAGHPALPGATGPTQPTGGVPHGAPSASDTTVAAGSIEKADQTVEGVISGAAALSGQTVKVRGKVVKFGQAIMGKNWVHLQDGSGSAGTNDLTVTTADAATVGEVIVVSGKVAVDQDYGYGYNYPVIMVEAVISRD